ncbi:MAG: glycine--tRNA ligase [Malacoplasma sp.]|nr:glycine--tRNA ligase [Malacoplasma sp.]
MATKVNQETIVNHLKTYGFIYPNSEIYNGLANAWDFGPLGVLLKNNLKNLWLKHFIFQNPNMYLLDSNIILNPLVWKASGHIDNFCDPLIDCKNCKLRYRADKLVENVSTQQINEQTATAVIEKIINDNNVLCPNCKKCEWTNIRKFNLLFETAIGVVDDKKDAVYLRPETAQGIFINFKNILRTQRPKLPFGVGQIGKAFRNEITPGNFIFRTREFEQMEIEFFCSEQDSSKWFDFFLDSIQKFLFEKLRLKKENVCLYDYPQSELAHYSKRTVDVLYNFPHGKVELWGIADRGRFDLSSHQELSKKNLEYNDAASKQNFIPCVIEPSVGVERLLYAIILDCYDTEILEDNSTRVVLRLCEQLAPYQFAILPLTNKLNEIAYKIYLKLLSYNVSCVYESGGSIGKRYRRQDAIGTPYCITIDFDTLKDCSFTVRDRDSMKQIRIKANDFNKIPNLFK